MKHVPDPFRSKPVKRPAHAPKASARLAAGRKFFSIFFLPMLGFSYCQDGVYVLTNPQPPGAPAVQANLVEKQQAKDEQWDAMVASLEDLARGYRGSAGIYLKDLNSDRVWGYNPDQLFTSASLIKVPIMVSVCEEIKRGELSLDTRLELTNRDRVSGSGTLKWSRSGTRLSVQQIMYKMITESDNTATRMLIDNAGFDYFQQAFAGLGLVHTNISPEGMNLRSGSVTRENYTTPREMAGLMERIYKGELVDKDTSELMLDILKHNKNRSRLRKVLPRGWELGHKTGLLRRSCHDVGIVFAPRGNYIIAVLTGEARTYPSAMKFITRVGKTTFQYYKRDAATAAAARPAASGLKTL